MSWEEEEAGHQRYVIGRRQQYCFKRETSLNVVYPFQKYHPRSSQC